MILFFHLAKGDLDRNMIHRIPDYASNPDLFREYLGENVFEHQPEHVRDFLLKTSILNRMAPTLCNRLLCIGSSDRMLDRLESNHLFTSLADEKENVYAYHHLFRDFLRDRFKKDLGEHAYLSLHQRAGELYENANELEEALHHYMEARCFKDIFRILENLGQKYLSHGRLARLNDILNSIPRTYLEQEPYALLFKTRLLLFDGQLALAEDYGNKAYALAMEKNRHDVADMILIELGRSRFIQGHFYSLEAIYAPLFEPPKELEFFHMEAFTALVFALSHVGETEKADAYYTMAVSLLNRYEPGNRPEGYLAAKVWLELNYSFRFCFSGEPWKAIRNAESIYYDMQELNSPPHLANYYHVLTGSYLIIGNVQRAREMAEIAFSHIVDKEEQGTQSAWLLIMSSLIFFLDRSYDEAIAEAEQALSEFRLGGSRWGELNALINLIAFYGESGQDSKATQTTMECMKIINEGYNIPHVEGRLNTYLGVYLIQTGQFEQAENHLSKAGALFHSILDLFHVKIFRAMLYKATGRKNDAVTLICEVLKTCETHHFEGSTILFIDDLTDLFLTIYASGQFRSYLVFLYASYWKHASKAVHAFKTSPDKTLRKAALEIIDKMPKPEAPPLKVNLLGKFNVCVGDREIDESEWKSGIAKQIFKYLVFRRNNAAVHRDVLLELIWPEEDVDKTVKRLHVALPSLRKTLEPNIHKGGSSYLVRDNDLYRIDFKNNGWVDVDLFLHEVKQADAKVHPADKLPHLIKAESLYKGEFNEEDPYTDWCIEERDRLKSTYVNVIKSLFTYHEQCGDLDRAILYAGKYLDQDPYEETMYARLMALYMDHKNYPMALKTYQACTVRIRDDLQCPLSRETTGLYQELIRRYPVEQTSRAQ